MLNLRHYANDLYYSQVQHELRDHSYCQSSLMSVTTQNDKLHFYYMVSKWKYLQFYKFNCPCTFAVLLENICCVNICCLCDSKIIWTSWYVMPLRALIKTGWPPWEKHTGGRTTAAKLYGHTVATPRACDSTMFIEVAQLDERRDVGKCFSAVWRTIIVRFALGL